MPRPISKRWLWIAVVAGTVSLAGVELARDANSSGGDRSCGEAADSARKAFVDAVQESSACKRDSECEVVPILVCPLGLTGRSMHVHGKFQTRLLGVRLSPLGFFASANLLDDERG
jgi:hypothetical protein